MELNPILTALVGLLVTAIGYLVKAKLESIESSLKAFATSLANITESQNAFKVEVAKSGIDTLRSDIRFIQNELATVKASDTKQWETLSKFAKRRTSDST